MLRNLIAPGVVDERSIEDVAPIDLRGFTQCHFFAGIGVWSYALRQAGWPDDRQVWTGSCPCQPFSAAGKREGFVDERHLWPAFYHLISQCNPDVVFGEQVASKDGLNWLDLVQTDLEAANYSCGSVDLCAAGVGSPQIRQRLWFVAERLGDTSSEGLPKQFSEREILRETENTGSRKTVERAGASASGLADSNGVGTEFKSGDNAQASRFSKKKCEPEHHTDVSQRSGTDSVEFKHSRSDGLQRNQQQPSPTNGFWGYVDWLGCRDGKFRPVEPGTFPLVNGTPARVGRLRGYGNALNAEVARVFIESYLEV